MRALSGEDAKVQDVGGELQMAFKMMHALPVQQGCGHRFGSMTNDK
jgi:hypothetical protein